MSRRFQIVDDFAGHQAVEARAVVADHAAEGAAGVAGRVGPIGEVVNFGGIAQTIENDAGLDAGDFGADRSTRGVHVAV